MELDFPDETPVSISYENIYEVEIEGIKLIRRTGNDEYGFIFVGAAPGIIFGSIVAYFTIQNLLLNIFAPKLWLLLEIENLIS